MNEKAMEPFGNEEFLDKLSKMEDIEDVKKALAEEGVTLDVDAIMAKVKIDDGELTEENLDDVSGGFLLTAAAALGAWSVGKAIGIIGRTVYEEATGKKRSYTTKQIRNAMNIFA